MHAGEAEVQRRVEAADIDAQLERVCRGDRPQVPSEQRLLYRTSLRGAVPRPVHGYRLHTPSQ